MKETKSKLAIISSLSTTAILVFSMNGSALTLVLNLSAWTDQSSYTLGDDVGIGAEWNVYDQDLELYLFRHTAAIVYMNITKSGTSIVEEREGWWQYGDQRGGAVYVTCLYDEGDASYTWDSDVGGSTGTWFVHVEAHAWDNTSNPPNHLYAWNQVDTSTFTLN